MGFDKSIYAEKFVQLLGEGFIVRSEASFLIASHHKNPPEVPDKIYWSQWAITIAYYSMLFAAKSAILSKGYEVKTHNAAQIALGHLLVPDELEREDVEVLNQAHKIFEDEYVKYFEDARTESSNARYKARPTYTNRQVADILKKSKLFVQRISVLVR